MTRISLHKSAKLSQLDLETAKHIPPGGNWKNVPHNIPLKRLETIRESYARGEGSRSTYYGRLRPDRPSYTINTYFTRPGNGCHLHYDFTGGQHRVISFREAARFQSFPDNFSFEGSMRDVAVQIGNAVPPFLALQIALTLSDTGQFIDLFSGAGGLGLGFKWAGWKPVLANDISEVFLRTHHKNVGTRSLVGDIRQAAIKNEIIKEGKKARNRNSGKPFWVLGGPPCQGFSTAGKARSKGDERNHLFWDYKEVLDAIEPDGFVFENVTGLLNMEKGEVFRQIREVLSERFEKIYHWVLSSEEFGVPQRRKRVFLIGTNIDISPPKPLTSHEARFDLVNGNTESEITAFDALSDLPKIESGEDGSGLGYISDPRNSFQAFIRNKLEPLDFLQGLER